MGKDITSCSSFMRCDGGGSRGDQGDSKQTMVVTDEEIVRIRQVKNSLGLVKNDKVSSLHSHASFD